MIETSQRMFYILMYTSDFEYLGHTVIYVSNPKKPEATTECTFEDEELDDGLSVEKDLLRSYTRILMAMNEKHEWLYLNKRYPLDTDDYEMVNNSSGAVAVKPSVVALISVEDSGIDIAEVLESSSTDEREIDLDIDSIATQEDEDGE